MNLLVHGSLYEHIGAGLEKQTSNIDDIKSCWSDARFVGFNSDGHWNYRGTSPQETEAETRERGIDFVSWLYDFIESVRCDNASGNVFSTVIVEAHQTYLDLILQLLINGNTNSAAGNWRYGSIRYHSSHTAITELQPQSNIINPWKLIRSNDSSHLK